MRVRGEICIGAATVLSLASLILVIFAHVGQINTSTVPRGISMMKVNVSLYGNALQTAIGDPVQGLYNFTPTTPLQQHAGLRQLYEFGLYSYCAYVNDTQGTCSNKTVANALDPYSVILADMPTNYTDLTMGFIPDTITFTDSNYLTNFSQGAYYLLLLGGICAALSMLVGIPKRISTYFAATVFAILGTLFLLVGVVIWTVLINKAQGINIATVQTKSTPVAIIPLGISVSIGPGLWLFWGAFISLLLSILPYMISCCTYRG